MLIKNAINIIGLTIILSTTLSSQYYEAGGGLGFMTYWGDLNAPDLETNLYNSNIGATAYMKYNFNGYYGIKTSLLHGKIQGDDSRSYKEWQTTRNLSFKSTYTELSITGEISPFKYNAAKGEHVFTPYIAIGLSGFYFNPKTLYNGQYYDLQPLGTEGQGIGNNPSKYSLFSGAILFGGGGKLKLTEDLNISLEIIARRTFTDYIDDVSTSYVDYNTLLSNNGEMSAILANRANELSDEMSDLQLEGQRGGKEVSDYVISTMVTVSYNIVGNNALRIFKKKSSVNCPKF